MPGDPRRPVGHFRLTLSGRLEGLPDQQQGPLPQRGKVNVEYTAQNGKRRSQRVKPRRPAAARSGIDEQFAKVGRNLPFRAFDFPAGGTGLPPEHVVESQRWRLLAAAGEVLAENGYARTGSADIAERAGVSRSTFYSQFENVEACLLAAYEMAADCIVDLVSGSCDHTRDPAGRLGIAVDAALGFLAEDPTTVRLLGSEAPAGVPAIAAARETFLGRLAELLRAARAPDGSLAGGPPEIERSLVGGALALVSEVAALDGAERLPAACPRAGRAPGPSFQARLNGYMVQMKLKPILAPVAVLLALSLAVVGCGGGDDGSTTTETETTSAPEETAPESETTSEAGGNAPAPSGEAVRSEKVEIVEFTYDPDPVTIQEGGKVIWLNQDPAPHTATADDGSFDTGTLEQGKLKSETFKEPGTFTYHCTIHPEMTGTIEVVPSG